MLTQHKTLLKQNSTGKKVQILSLKKRCEKEEGGENPQYQSSSQHKILPNEQPKQTDHLEIIVIDEDVRCVAVEDMMNSPNHIGIKITKIMIRVIGIEVTEVIKEHRVALIVVDHIGETAIY